MGVKSYQRAKLGGGGGHNDDFFVVRGCLGHNYIFTTTTPG